MPTSNEKFVDPPESRGKRRRKPEPPRQSGGTSGNLSIPGYEPSTPTVYGPDTPASVIAQDIESGGVGTGTAPVGQEVSPAEVAAALLAGGAAPSTDGKGKLINDLLEAPKPKIGEPKKEEKPKKVKLPNIEELPSVGPQGTKFAEWLSHYSGIDPRVAAGWVLAEGAGETGTTGGEAGKNNWLAAGYPAEKTPFSESPYFAGSPKKAAKSTVKWMAGKIGDEYGYPASEGIKSILPKIRGHHLSPEDQVKAIGESGWLGGSEGELPTDYMNNILENAQGVNVRGSINAPDVVGGQGEMVKVRADAKGMAQWAEHLEGVQEGSGKQLNWASKLGLGSSEPWCANFISNGLLRHGFTPEQLPSNPNNTGSPGFEAWAEEGKHARNLGTDLARAKPGDILTFSGAHTALYVGNGEMVSGNFSDEVERTPVSEGPAELSMIIRPKYKGGTVQMPVQALNATSSWGVPSESLASGGGSESPLVQAALERTAPSSPSEPAASSGPSKGEMIMALLNAPTPSVADPTSTLSGDEDELMKLIMRRVA